MQHGFSGNKQVIKFQKIKEIVVEFVYFRQQNIENFYLKDKNYGCVSDHIVSFLDAAVTIHVFTMYNNAVKLVET